MDSAHTSVSSSSSCIVPLSAAQQDGPIPTSADGSWPSLPDHTPRETQAVVRIREIRREGENETRGRKQTNFLLLLRSEGERGGREEEGGTNAEMAPAPIEVAIRSKQ